MLKGKMTIELTDVKTGKTDTVLEQNMITNALAQYFKPLGLASDPSKMLNSYLPFNKYPLGGVLLFDNAIEENPDNYYPPAEAALVGCAVYGEQNSTTGKKRGAYNTTESELNLHERYMKYVYDFATSQANGTIASVCLTHRNGGFTSYGAEDAVRNSSYPLFYSIDNGQLQYVYNNSTNFTGASTGDKCSGCTFGTTELLFAIDRAADLAYYFRVETQDSISIISRRAYLRNVSVLENPRTQKALVDEVPINDLNLATSSSYLAYNFDPAENCLYIFGSDGSYIKPGQTFRICKISMNTWAVTQYTMTNTTDVNLLTANYMRWAFGHRGYVYLRTYSSPYQLYKFEIGNSANVVKLDLKGMETVIGYPQFAVNGRIYYEDYSSGDYSYVVNDASNEVTKMECGYLYTRVSSYRCCFTPVIGEPMLYFASAGQNTYYGFIILTNYLATINNLAEPVTKTADKTMKITYIIQEQ